MLSVLKCMALAICVLTGAALSVIAFVPISEIFDASVIDYLKNSSTFEDTL